MTEPGPKHLPGEVGVWVFILGDLVVFTILFATFLYYRVPGLQLYLEGHKTLRQDLATINTFLLLTSSWFVVMALSAARKRELARTRLNFSLAAACGCAFVLLKYLEYREKFVAGINILTNDFYTYYFILTGVHLLHVIVGLAVLFFLVQHASTARESVDITLVESGCVYWHMVDFLWIIIFSLIYLMG